MLDPKSRAIQHQKSGCTVPMAGNVEGNSDESAEQPSAVSIPFCLDATFLIKSFVGYTTRLELMKLT